MSLNDSLKFGRQRRYEMGVREHIPYLRHVNDHVVSTKLGFLVSVIKLEGLPFQTMDQAELNARMRNRNNSFRLLGSSRFSLYTTVIRRKSAVAIDDDFDMPFAAELNRRYREHLSQKNLFVNDIYLTIVRRHMLGKIGWVDRALSAFSHGAGESESRTEALRELEEATLAMVQDFAPYGARRLGVAERRGSVFSEPAEFFAKIVSGGDPVEMPLPRMSLAEAIPTAQLLFGRNALEIRGSGEMQSKVGAMVSMKEYPPFTAPGGTDGLLRLPYEFILTQSFAVEDRAAAMQIMRRVGNQVATSDVGGTQMEASVHQGLDKLAQGEVVFGYHHMSICVFESSVSRLNRAVSDVQSELSRMSVVPVRESLNMEPAFWAQLPGNFSYIARRGLISSANFAGLFSGHNFPSGETQGLHWKKPIAIVETANQTAYNFSFHVNDSGNFTIVGPTGSGKTAAMAFLMAQSMRIRPRPRCIYFDKDRGADIFIRALGGHYEVLEPGTPTGFAPLQIDDTPANRAFANTLLSYLLNPTEGALSASEKIVIADAVGLLFEFPRERRSLKMLTEVLRGRLQPGENDLARRLEPWLDPANKGWLFNNPVDRLDFSSQVIGFDMTSVLDDPETRTAALMYLFHRIEGVLDGTPTMIFLDEGWKLLDDAVFPAFLRDLLKTIRKKNGIVGFGTQSAADIVESSISSAIIEQTTSNIFLPNAKASAAVYRDHFLLSAKEFDFIKTAPPESRAMLVKRANDSVVVKLDLSSMPDLMKVLSGRIETVRECEELRARYGDDPAQWLSRFTEYDV
ncbi:VirB4 family type IV secretion/conjugal transfer ATPase [Neorhizobium sp. AL 9.2.2]|uniref:VirB4 family type IV secretion/conjugal transfer ATPase n=1 Tax=Neorhizobium sp. AL 9.2.2 TaxID=2712894 RepID=UPI001571A1B1|nr:VirB4 family type IV secretion/conjugal transfer ATPase [Neorhizobium sp. AL 9.2.2]